MKMYRMMTEDTQGVVYELKGLVSCIVNLKSGVLCLVFLKSIRRNVQSHPTLRG